PITVVLSPAPSLAPQWLTLSTERCPDGPISELTASLLALSLPAFKPRLNPSPNLPPMPCSSSLVHPFLPSLEDLARARHAGKDGFRKPSFPLFFIPAGVPAGVNQIGTSPYADRQSVA